MFKQNPKKLIFFVVSFLIVIFVSILIPSLRQPVLGTLKYPLQFLTLLDREFKGIIFYHRNLIQNQDLRRQVGLLNQKISNTKEIYFENIRLKNLLSLKEQLPYKVIVSRVIARSPDNWSSIVIIDKGRANGIKKGFVVIDYLGLLGRVIEAGQTTSKVMLINDPNVSVSSIVQRSRQEGLISGTLGNQLIMRYLPKDADIVVTDIVMTSGLTEFYPKGILIGTVVEVSEEFSGLSHYAIIKPNANISNCEEVLIIIQ
ncbi:MAG: rod shape-determining protein MreC [Candidatus Omnitrophota bacterium]